MKKLLSLALSLVCLFSCISCFPVVEPEKEPIPYALHLEKFATVCPVEGTYFDPHDAYFTPDETAVYYFYRNGPTENKTHCLAKVDLIHGGGEILYDFGEEYPAGILGMIGLHAVQWEGDVLTFCIGETIDFVTKFSYNTKTAEMTAEKGLPAPPITSAILPKDESERELLDYNLPDGAQTNYAAVVNNKLYQIYSLNKQSYYRQLDLSTKKEYCTELNGQFVFYGPFILQKMDKVIINELRTFNKKGEFVSVTTKMPQSIMHAQMQEYKEFLIWNSDGVENWYFAKDGVLNPLTVTFDSPFEANITYPLKELAFYKAQDDTIYFFAYEKTSDGVLQYYFIKGTIEPFAHLTEN